MAQLGGGGGGYDRGGVATWFNALPHAARYVGPLFDSQPSTLRDYMLNYCDAKRTVHFHGVEYHQNTKILTKNIPKKN